MITFDLGDSMKDRPHTAKWLHSAYIVYGIVFTGLLGGLIEILAIADYINFGIVRLLEANPIGLELHGKFLFPRNWFALAVILICLMFLFPATSLLRYLSNEDKDREAERKLVAQIVSLRQDMNDIIRYAENITNYIYPGDVDLGRFDTKRVHVKHDISDNGDTLVEALITIACTSEPAHFYRYWINADPESEGVDYFRNLRFEATDSDTGRKLDFLPIKNGAKNKMFAIFFPEVAPGMQMTLRICYIWPGFMRKLIELGATNFNCQYLSKSPNSRAPLTMEWNFSNKIAKLNCRIAGRQSNSASILSESRVSSTAWIYYDPEATMNAGTTYTVEFARVN